MSNASVVISRLSQEETALTATNDILQRIRVLALQANNATIGNEARRQIGVEVRAQLSVDIERHVGHDRLRDDVERSEMDGGHRGRRGALDTVLAQEPAVVRRSFLPQPLPGICLSSLGSG